MKLKNFIKILLFLVQLLILKNKIAAQAPCSGFNSFHKPTFTIKTTLDSVKIDSNYFGICMRLDSSTVVIFYMDSANRQIALYNGKTSADSPDTKLSCLNIFDPLYSPMCGSPSCSEDTGTALVNNLCSTCDSTAAGIKFTCIKTAVYFLYVSDRNNNKVGGWLKFKAEPKPNDTIIYIPQFDSSACPLADTINRFGFFKKMKYPSTYASNDTVLAHKGFGYNIQRTYWLHVRLDSQLSNVTIKIQGQIPDTV